jgi:DNA-binding HxlR family transcriptional regulator
MTELVDRFPEATDFSECTRHLLPLMDTMDVLNGRWKFTILLALWFGGKMRFKELQRNVRGITGKVLSKELKSLEEHRILTRTVFDTAPISVVYELTDYGKTLDKVMVELREWGIQHRKKMIGK